MYRKFGEAYMMPPWLMPSTISIPQWFAFFYQDVPRTDEEMIALANRIRAKKGLSPLKA